MTRRNQNPMPVITVEGAEPFDAPEGKKLVLAIEDAGIDILHRCGGEAHCTTCRVEVLSGNVPPISDAEKDALEDPDLIAQYRLSCQLRIASDMHVKIWGRASEKEMSPGPRPED
jgi:ferredoxin